MLIILLLLFYPQVGFSFSENELDSLEDSGKKTFSKSPWRRSFSFGLQRNMDLNTFHDAGFEAQQRVFSLDEKGSLFDISNLYYSIGLGVNYSLSETAKKWKYDFLKNAELFMAGSFATPFTGYNNLLDDYDAWQYTHYAIGDLTFGFTTPIYQKENLFADLSSSSFIPLSKFSQEAGLFSGITGSLGFLYFLKKESKWNVSLSSGHSLNYRYYTASPLDRAKEKEDEYEELLSRGDREKTYDIAGQKHSTPWSAGNSGSIAFKQTFSKAFPTRATLTLGHNFGIETNESRKHYFSWRFSSSWKVKERFYVNASIRWRDLVDISNPNPKHSDIAKNSPIGWDDLRKYVFSLSGSYSF